MAIPDVVLRFKLAPTLYVSGANDKILRTLKEEVTKFFLESFGLTVKAEPSNEASATFIFFLPNNYSKFKQETLDKCADFLREKGYTVETVLDHQNIAE